MTAKTTGRGTGSSKGYMVLYSFRDSSGRNSFTQIGTSRITMDTNVRGYEPKTNLIVPRLHYNIL